MNFNLGWIQILATWLWPHDWVMIDTCTTPWIGTDRWTEDRWRYFRVLGLEISVMT